MTKIEWDELQSSVKWAGELGNKIKGASNVTELFDVIANAVGAEAYAHFENLVEGQSYKERRATEREMAPWSQLDVDLLQKLVPGVTGADRARLEGIIEQMAEVKLRAQRGY